MSLRLNRCGSLLMVVVLGSLLPAAEQSVAELLTKASTGLTQFTFDWPQPLFREALSRATPDSDEWAHATFGLATCRLYVNPVTEDGVAEATKLFGEILTRTPTSRFAPNACMTLGRIAEQPDFYKDQADLPGARLRYQEVMAKWPDLPMAGEAALRLAGTYATTNTPEDARLGITTLQDWLKTHPADPLAAAMYQFMGDTTYLRLADKAGSLPFYLKADDLGLPSKTKAWKIHWRIAQTAQYEAHDLPLAIRYYTRICTDSQTSGKAFEAQLALAKLGAPVPELTAFAAYQGTRPAMPKPAAPAAPAIRATPATTVEAKP